MPLTLIDSFASGQPDGNGHSVSKIFTRVRILMADRPIVSAVSDTMVGTVNFTADARREVRRASPGNWILFLRHNRSSLLKDDLEILSDLFTLGDFTFSITIDNPDPISTPVNVSDTPVHIVPC